MPSYLHGTLKGPCTHKSTRLVLPIVGRKLGRDRSKPRDFKSQGGNDDKAAGTGSLEHLVPRWVATEAMSTKTAYDEPVESI